jgi:hypothetical protein
MAKDDGLGVLDNNDDIKSGLRGIQKALRNRDKDQGIKDALNAVRDIKNSLSKSTDDARQLRRKVKDVVKVLTKGVLPLISK